MRHALTRHPSSAGGAVARVEADVTCGDSLAITYLVTGRIAHLVLPHFTTPVRTDELWRHTCFEAFAGAEPGGAYYEFNFSPSTQWAAYRFSGYRKGMTAADITPPCIRMESNDDTCALTVELGLGGLALLKREWRLGLSAVIEELGGRKSYWALAHPQGDPDFHHSVCFALSLPAA